MMLTCPLTDFPGIIPQFLWRPTNLCVLIMEYECACRCERTAKRHEEVHEPLAGIEHLAHCNSFLMSSSPYAALIKCLRFSIN